MDHGPKVAYTVVAEGTPVLASDGTQVGTVRRVLADEASNIFDGLTLDTDRGERFVDAPEVAELYERAVVLALSPDDARRLPEHRPAPAVVDVDPGDLAGKSTGDKAEGVLRRAWNRISGNY